MESFKQLMGFFLLAAVLFLLNTIGGLSGKSAMVAVMLGLLLVGVGVWVYGRWSLPTRSAPVRAIAMGFALLFLVAGTWYGATSSKLAYDQMVSGTGATMAKPLHEGWVEWSLAKQQETLAEGKAVFVDFTAEWCLICQTNKWPLNSDQVTKAFEKAGVVPMEADWTRWNPEITQQLEKFGRSGVPLYVLYSPDSSVEPVILPQTLTSEIVVEAVEKLPKGSLLQANNP